MRRGGFGQAARRLPIVITAVVGLGVALAPAESAATALVSGLYQLNYDQTITRKGPDKTDLRILKQALEIKFKGFLSPVVRNEVTFRVEQEINSNEPDITRLLPMADLGFKGRYWEAKGGAKRTHENSDDPAKNPKTTDSYFLELFYLPRKSIPDLKFKYTIDTDFEQGVTDTRKDGLTVSSVYALNNWLEIKGDYTHDLTKDSLQPNADLLNQKRSLSVSIRRAIHEKIRFDSRYTYDQTRGGTILDVGGLKNEKNDQNHSVKNTLSIRPFRDTSMDGSYDVDLKQNMVTGEHNLTTTAKATLTQAIGRPLNVKLEAQRVVTEAKHTADDFRAPEDTYTGEVAAKFAKQLDFLFKYQSKSKDEVHTDPTKSKKDATVNKSATWTGELARFWKAAVSYDATDTFSNDVKITIDSKYSFKTTFDFKGINLMIEPTYDITRKEDLVKPEQSETRDFKFKFVYRILSTRNLEAKVDHTYGRLTDSLAKNIKRTDSTTGNVVWKEPLPGWMLGFDLMRSATDTSGDDLPPDITTTFAFKADYKYNWLTIAANYKYDKKSLTDDTSTLDLKVGWLAPMWEASVGGTYTKTFSTMLDEELLISLQFKYLIQ